jgi:malic enzyme
VAAACEAIVDDPLTAAHYTARGNLVAVVSNGTAVLGLGAIGPLASKPVMEGKAVLFKKFADIDVFDIEVDAATRAAGRDRRRAGADLRRHQPGGHQGAGLLHRRAGAEGAHEHPGLP